MYVYVATYGCPYPQSKFVMKCGMKFYENLYKVKSFKGI